MAYMSQAHQNSNDKFQLERLILFSDAVFAIAITLLVIDIKIPEISHSIVTDHLLSREMNHLIPRFAGFIISFAIVGLYWTVHHKIFAFADHYDNKLLWLNLFFLFSIALMPFSSGFYGEYAAKLNLLIPYGFYCFNICLTGILNYLLWRYISSKKTGISAQTITRSRKNYGSLRSLVVPFAFLISFLVSIFNPNLGRYMPILIPITMKIAQRYYAKKDPTLKY